MLWEQGGATAKSSGWGGIIKSRVRTIKREQGILVGN